MQVGCWAGEKRERKETERWDGRPDFNSHVDVCSSSADDEQGPSCAPGKLHEIVDSSQSSMNQWIQEVVNASPGARWRLDGVARLGGFLTPAAFHKIPGGPSGLAPTKGTRPPDRRTVLGR